MTQDHSFNITDMLSDDFADRLAPLKAADRVYYQILEQIISLRLPPGSLLQERALAEKLNVSRTPVREATQRLAQNGWLEVRARSHLLVRPVTELDIAEVFEVRSMIEPLAVRGLFEKGFLSQALPPLRELAGRMEHLRDDRFRFMKADQLFHLYFFIFFDNSRLTRFWEVMILETVRIGIIAMQSNNRFADVMREHWQILDAMARHQKKAALKAVQDHLQITREHVYKNLNLPLNS